MNSFEFKFSDDISKNIYYDGLNTTTGFYIEKLKNVFDVLKQKIEDGKSIIDSSELEEYFNSDKRGTINSKTVHELSERLYGFGPMSDLIVDNTIIKSFVLCLSYFCLFDVINDKSYEKEAYIVDGSIEKKKDIFHRYLLIDKETKQFLNWQETTGNTDNSFTFKNSAKDDGIKDLIFSLLYKELSKCIYENIIKDIIESLIDDEHFNAQKYEIKVDDKKFIDVFYTTEDEKSLYEYCEKILNKLYESCNDEDGENYKKIENKLFNSIKSQDYEDILKTNSILINCEKYSKEIVLDSSNDDKWKYVFTLILFCSLFGFKNDEKLLDASGLLVFDNEIKSGDKENNFYVPWDSKLLQTLNSFESFFNDNNKKAKFVFRYGDNLMSSSSYTEIENWRELIEKGITTIDGKVAHTYFQSKKEFKESMHGFVSSNGATFQCVRDDDEYKRGINSAIVIKAESDNEFPFINGNNVIASLINILIDSFLVLCSSNVVTHTSIEYTFKYFNEKVGKTISAFIPEEKGDRVEFYDKLIKSYYNLFEEVVKYEISSDEENKISSLEDTKYAKIIKKWVVDGEIGPTYISGTIYNNLSKPKSIVFGDSKLRNDFYKKYSKVGENTAVNFDITNSNFSSANDEDYYTVFLDKFFVFDNQDVSNIDIKITNEDDIRKYRKYIFIEKEDVVEQKVAVIGTGSSAKYDVISDNHVGKGILSKLILTCFYNINKNSKAEYNSTTVFTIDSTNYSSSNGTYNVNKLAKDLAGILSKVFDDIFNAIKKKESVSSTVKNLLKESVNYEDFVGELKKNSCKEDEFFYIGSTTKTAPANPYIKVEFVVPEITEDNKAKPHWITVTGDVKQSNAVTRGANQLGVVPKNNKAGLYYTTATGDAIQPGAITVGTKQSSNGIKVSNLYLSGNSEEDILFNGTYFDSIEINDDGGAKKATLTLRSPRDLNLEKIILNSLSTEEKLLSADQSNQTQNYNVGMITSMVKNASSNFRVKFGYKDNYGDYIRCDESYDYDFSHRAKERKPVKDYPWTYFKIVDMECQLLGEEYVYTISGVDSCSYMLNNLRIGGISNYIFDGDAQTDERVASPKNVLGTIASWIFDASNGSICVLGSGQNKIATGTKYNSVEGNWYDGFEVEENLKYELKGNKGSLKPSDFDIESKFFVSNGSITPTIEFNPIDSEDNDIISVGTLLDKLTEWLPRRLYYICKVNDKTTAARLSYEDAENLGSDWYEKEPHVSETIRYQILEAEAKIIDENGNDIEKEFSKKYFIRFFFEGPRMSIDSLGNSVGSTDDVLRIYSHNSSKTQVIKDISLNNGGIMFSNIAAALNVIGGKEEFVFFSNMSNTMTSDGKIGSSRIDKEEYLKARSGKENSNLYLLPCQTLTNSYIGSENSNNEADYALSSARQLSSAYFTALSHQNYTGTMTIIGDPFFYFDSYLQPCSYMLYLDENRVENLKSSKLGESYFTGTYVIDKITHNISCTNNSPIDFSTTLSIIKYKI